MTLSSVSDYPHSMPFSFSFILKHLHSHILIIKSRMPQAFLNWHQYSVSGFIFYAYSQMKKMVDFLCVHRFWNESRIGLFIILYACHHLIWTTWNVHPAPTKETTLQCLGLLSTATAHRNRSTKRSQCTTKWAKV